MKEVQQSAQRRLSELTRVRHQTAEEHVEKMSSLLCTHQQELQSLQDDLSAKLKVKEQADRQEIQGLESRLTAVTQVVNVIDKERVEKLKFNLTVLQVTRTKQKKHVN